MKTLIDKFLSGETTIAEEKRLKQYFAPGNTVDPSLECYRQMFSFYSELSHRQKACKTAPPFKRRSRRVFAWISSAAAVALLVGAGLSQRFSQADDLASFYAGSYATVNGKRLTDIEDILKAQAEADAFCQRVEDMAAADFERLTSENLEK